MLLPVLCFSMLMLTACLCDFVYLFSLVGTWNVYDLVGTKSIGSTEVTFKPQGELSVKPPMQVSSIILCTYVLLEYYYIFLTTVRRVCDGGLIPDQLIWIRARSRC
jgi:hypothetical protein